MNRNCSACNKKIDTINYKKGKSVCKTCYNKNKNERKNTLPPNTNIVPDQQPKLNNVSNKDSNLIVSAHENHAYVVVGARNVGKIYYMLKKLKKIGNERPIHIITRSLNQYPNYKTTNEINPIKNTKDRLLFLTIC